MGGKKKKKLAMWKVEQLKWGQLAKRNGWTAESSGKNTWNV